MKDHLFVPASSLQKGDKLLSTDNRTWTVDSIQWDRLREKITIFCSNGQNNMRFIWKPSHEVRKLA